jgi:hypothetical protein
VIAVLKDGRKVHVFVEHAIGSLQNPMTDAMLEAKFHSMADAVIGAEKTSKLIAASWKLGDLPDVRALTLLASP